jgi:aryl-alcohol dehydrogenase-like predicted oxidoreductase
MKIILGTAQLGMDYGVNNELGKPSPELAQEIVDVALASGITDFDTARGYGDSEAVLGECLSKSTGAKKYHIITKVPKLSELTKDDLVKVIQESLDKLGRIDTLLLHHVDDMYEADLLSGYIALQKVFQCNLGVSVYTPEEALHALEQDWVSCIQVPSNLADMRFVEAGIFALAKEKRVRIMVRSVYLQGLVFAKQPPGHLANLPGLEVFLNEVNAFCEQWNCSPQELALSVACLYFDNADILIGVETASQLEETLTIFKRASKNLEIASAWNKVTRTVTDELIDPRTWNEFKK